MKQQHTERFKKDEFSEMDLQSQHREEYQNCFIEKLRNQERIQTAEMLELRKMLFQGLLRDSILHEALEHVILHRLAEGGKVKKIKTDSIPSFVGMEPYRKGLNLVL